MTNNDYEERKQAEETKRLLEEARLRNAKLQEEIQKFLPAAPKPSLKCPKPLQIIA